MVHPDDLVLLQAVLGVEELPKDVVAEYEQWQRCYHKAGWPGPIGVHGVVCLVRMLRKEVTAPGVKQTELKDGLVGSRVSVKVDKKTVLRGVCKSIVEPGLYSVLIDGASETSEYPEWMLQRE